MIPLFCVVCFQSQHYRYLPRPADFKGADEGTVVGCVLPVIMLVFYEFINGIHHDVTLPVFHNDWLVHFAEIVRLADDDSTTFITPPQVAPPKVVDLRKKAIWQMKTLAGGGTVTEHIHHQRGSDDLVWVGMFDSSEANKHDYMPQTHSDPSAAGVTKDCDNKILSAAPDTPA